MYENLLLIQTNEHLLRHFLHYIAGKSEQCGGWHSLFLLPSQNNKNTHTFLVHHIYVPVCTRSLYVFPTGDVTTAELIRQRLVEHLGALRALVQAMPARSVTHSKHECKRLLIYTGLCMYLQHLASMYVRRNGGAINTTSITYQGQYRTS